nr:DUF488 domain-containing protein [Methanobacterium formicicum]
MVVDVRTSPYSKYSPHFNKKTINEDSGRIRNRLCLYGKQDRWKTTG